MRTATKCTTLFSIRSAAPRVRVRRRAPSTFLVLMALAGWHECSLAPAFGDITVFQQLPLLGTPPGAPYPGHDVQSTVTTVGAPATSAAVSDDFELSTSAPLTSMTWWGAPLLTPDPHFFSVIFSANVPASGGVPSHPGSTLSSTPFAQPGWGVVNPLYNSAPVSDPGDPVLFEKYTATFPTPISLQASTVYWLTIQADDFTLSENALNWGWHTRDYTIQDSLAPGDTLVGTAAGLPVYNFGGSALSQAYSNVGLAQGSPTALSYAPGTDGPAGIGAFGMGMAFALNAVPEPSTIVLAAMGGLALLACRWRNIKDAKHRPTAE